MVIPTSLRDPVLNMLHHGHPGVSATRELARFTVYWPGLDEAVEKFVQNCGMPGSSLEGAIGSSVCVERTQ